MDSIVATAVTIPSYSEGVTVTEQVMGWRLENKLVRSNKMNYRCEICKVDGVDTYLRPGLHVIFEDRCM